jgi:hypothetical protein
MISTGKTIGILLVSPDGKVGITSDGGLAISLTNKTGTTTTQGYLVHPSSSTDEAFDYVPDDEADIMGVVFGDDNGAQVADGVACWVVVTGVAKVYTIAAATREDFVRAQVTADGGAVGAAVAEAMPGPPFATDKHFQEVGHVIETTGGAGLARCVLHFN